MGTYRAIDRTYRPKAPQAPRTFPKLCKASSSCVSPNSGEILRDPLSRLIPNFTRDPSKGPRASNLVPSASAQASNPVGPRTLFSSHPPQLFISKYLYIYIYRLLDMFLYLYIYIYRLLDMFANDLKNTFFKVITY